MAWILLRSGHQIARKNIKIVKTCSFWHPLPKRALHADVRATGKLPQQKLPLPQQKLPLRLNDVRANIVWSWFQNDHMAYVLRMIIHLHMQVSPGYNPWTLLLYDKDSVASDLDLIVMSAGGGGAECPETSKREIFADLVSGKDRQGKWGKKEENWKSEAEKFKMERGNCFFFFFFHAPLFSKWLKFVLGLPKWKFSTRNYHM